MYYADAYHVYIDGTEATQTSDNTYTSAALASGDHSAYVETWVGGLLKATSGVLNFDIVGKATLPAENLEVVSVEKDGSYYNVTIRFTLPKTKATVENYKLFYGPEFYNYEAFTDVTKVGNTVTATVPLSHLYVTEEDPYTGEDVPRTDVPLSVVVVYAEGGSPRSDVVL